MEKSILFVGVDVDDRAFNCYFTTPDLKETGHFKCKPNSAALASKFDGLVAQGFDLRICYEATYLGFSLQRALRSRGFDCQVIAPSLIPELPGKAQKTDRLDSKKLAEFYAKDLLTVVHVPNEQDESVRDLVRSRLFTVRQIVSLKNHIVGLCRRAGIHYATEREGKGSLWSNSHRVWLRNKITEKLTPTAQMNIQMLLIQLEHLDANALSVRVRNRKNLSSGALSKTCSSPDGISRNRYSHCYGGALRDRRRETIFPPFPAYLLCRHGYS